MITPALGCSFVIISTGPHLRGGLFCEALLILSLGVGSASSPCKDGINQPCPSWIPRWLQERKTLSKNRYNMETEMLSFSLVFS
jgi:hypothetical protein